MTIPQNMKNWTTTMDTKHDDGGQAYPMPSGPEPRVDAFTHFNEGMTLKDHFAGLAMQSAIAACPSEKVEAFKVAKRGISAWAYDMAAGMVEEKRRRETTTGD